MLSDWTRDVKIHPEMRMLYYSWKLKLIKPFKWYRAYVCMADMFKHTQAIEDELHTQKL